MENKSRSQYFDAMKGIAIILVLIGHSIQYGNGADFLANNDFYRNFLFKTIYSFHMPLFMWISGFFFQSSYNKYSTAVFIIKKIKSIIVPIVSFSFLYFMFTKYNLHDGLMLSIRRFIWTILSFKIYWFLWATFVLSILFLFIKKIKNNYIRVGG